MDLSKIEQEKKEKAQELKRLYENKELSYDEYTELVEDLLNIEKLSGMLDTEEKKILVEKAFLAIKMAAGLAK